MCLFINIQRKRPRELEDCESDGGFPAIVHVDSSNEGSGDDIVIQKKVSSQAYEDLGWLMKDWVG